MSNEKVFNFSTLTASLVSPHYTRTAVIHSRARNCGLCYRQGYQPLSKTLSWLLVNFPFTFEKNLGCKQLLWGVFSNVKKTKRCMKAY